MKGSFRPWRRALSGIFLSAGLAMPVFASDTASVTLDEAIAIALSQNTQARIAFEAIGERTAEARQAGLPPNPELGLEVENVLGSGLYRGTEEADVTLGLTQRIETGGKRENRKRLSRLSEAVAAAERDVVERRLREAVTHAFNGLLAAQQEAETTSAAAERVRGLVPALRQRFERGASSEADLNRGLLALDLAEIRAGTKQAELRTAQQTLLALWSESAYRPLRAEGAFAVPATPLPGLDELEAMLDSHPAVLGGQQTVSVRRAAFDLEKSNAYPDVTLGAGARHFAGTDESAFLFSVSIPISVFDRNQGNIDAASSRVVQADLDARRTRVELARELQQSHQTYSSRCREAERLGRSVVPTSAKTSAAIREGYLAGRFGVLDLLDALQTSADSRMQETEALLACRNALASIEILTGLSGKEEAAEGDAQ
ncbi:TolC family protein [Parvibaculum lavamentivorans]|jgi:cobalt-zinc-cadmium efflux system outer membrane protein|nr:TolC family protein [Parvibaculum lavamentivorans]|tara:strand:- start:163303 stop:164592 length:1290 start_codon:yes stop_codon:yes gene_type:complete